MNYREKFKKDLTEGQLYEDWFYNKFLNKHKKEINNDKKWDIKAGGKTYEIKCDKQGFVYYRVGFEVSSWGKPSGIWTTEADYWVNISPIFNKVLIIPIDKLKYFIKKHHGASIFRKCGDGFQSKMILWDWDFFIINLIEEVGPSVVYNCYVPNLCSLEETNKLRSDFERYYKRGERKSRCKENQAIENHYETMMKKFQYLDGKKKIKKETC